MLFFSQEDQILAIQGACYMARNRSGTPLQYSCLENPMDRGAWWASVHGVAKSWTRLSDFTFTFHFPALEKEMATHSSVLAWRILGMGEPGGLPSMGSHRVGHDWSDLAAAADFDEGHSDKCEVINHYSFDLFFSYNNQRCWTCASWPSVCLLWRNIYSCLLPSFLIWLFVFLIQYGNFELSYCKIFISTFLHTATPIYKSPFFFL